MGIRTSSISDEVCFCVYIYAVRKEVGKEYENEIEKEEYMYMVVDMKIKKA